MVIPIPASQAKTCVMEKMKDKMHISALTTGLLGLATTASAQLIHPNTTGIITSNTTTTTTNSHADKTGVPIKDWAIHQGPGPVIIPTNTTNGSTNKTHPKKEWFKYHPLGRPGGHGPVIIPDDKWDDIPTTTTPNTSYRLWLTPGDEDVEDPALNRDPRRVSTQDRRRRLIAKRDGPGDPLPPRDRTLADHMENHGSMLPECYKTCMRKVDGRDSIHMGKDSLGLICGSKWTMFAWWSEHPLYGCVNGDGGCANKEDHRVAYRWLKWTCGNRPA
ncbi:hypothetical protein KVR01_007930 [Diaporthe batatas]|uniref:uncharacterized protein n=1 Tax=Diaporthe batatas TaxID=748121 RepID=UPI001D036F95|nr:uncharacterized protein KVR01_007930 [Diaporthe batatas]KAG8162165.1 hypothetical protein KVR01_007930 [Diaporthe batatas]